MGDITERLSRHEFGCSCCGLADPHPVLVISVQTVVDETPCCRAVLVTGGGRCDDRNAVLFRKNLAGEFSSHRFNPNRGMYSEAGDFVFIGARTDKVLQQVEKIPAFANGGVGVYLDKRKGKRDRIHLDVRRSGRARWWFVDGKKVSSAVYTAEFNRRFIK